jgi:hypothetical protein
VRADLSKLQGDLSAAKPVTSAALNNASANGGRLPDLDLSSINKKFVEDLDDLKKELSITQPAIDANSNSLNNWNKVATRAGEITTNLVSNWQSVTIVAGALTYAFHKMSQAASSFLGRGSQVADTWENVRIEIDQLTGSAKVTGDMMDRLIGFSLDSGLLVPQIYELSRSMIKAEYTAGQMDATLRMLMDAAGGNSSRFQTLARVYGRMADGGIRASRAFMTLKAQGILTNKELMAYFKTTEKGLNSKLMNATAADLTRILKISTEAGGQMHGAFAKAAMSSTALSAQLQRNLDLLSSQVWESINEWASALTIVMTNVVKLFSALPKFLKSGFAWFLVGAAGASVLLAGLLGIVTACSVLVPAIVAVGTAFGVTLGPALAALVALSILVAPLIIGIWSAFAGGMGIMDAMMATWYALAAAWEYFLSVLERAGFFKIWNNVLDIFDRVVGVVAGVAGSIMRLIMPAFQALGSFLDGVLVGTLWAILSPIELFTEILLEGLEWLQVFAESLDSIFKQIPNLITAAMLVAVDVIGNAMNLIVDGIKMSLMAAIQGIGRVIEEMLVMKAKLVAKLKLSTLSAEKEAEIRADAKAGTAGAVGAIGPLSKTKGLTQLSETTRDFMKNSGLMGLIGNIFDRKDELKAGRRNNRKPEGVPEGKEYGSVTERGIYGIGDFGKMIQDSFLKQDDPTTEAVKFGNELQQKQLDLAAMTQQTLEQGLGLV